MAVIIVAVTLHPGTTLGRALSWRPLVAVGLISYGLYLWHWPVFVWMSPDRMGFSGWGLTAARFAVAFGLAYASYRLIERPIRRGRAPPAPRHPAGRDGGGGPGGRRPRREPPARSGRRW